MTYQDQIRPSRVSFNDCREINELTITEVYERVGNDECMTFVKQCESN